MNALEKYDARVAQANSLICVGLDSDLKYIPRQFRDDPFPQFAFNRWIIEETHHYVSAYKPNMAFYEARGDRGLAELKMTIDYLQERHPSIFTICDARRGDAGSTNIGYVEAVFDWLGFDAVTIQPYPGKQAAQPFLDRVDRASIILCRTSNPGGKEFQDIEIDGKPLWQHVAQRVHDEWNVNDNCVILITATYPPEVQQARAIVDRMTILAQGVGSQSGALKKVVEGGLNQEKKGLMISSSRSIIFSDNPTAAVRRLRDDINQLRK
ncbi:MAG: orotidine-5'-phosphate decarboxylase [Anaerolineae bacterium]